MREDVSYVYWWVDGWKNARPKRKRIHIQFFSEMTAVIRWFGLVIGRWHRWLQPTRSRAPRTDHQTCRIAPQYSPGIRNEVICCIMADEAVFERDCTYWESVPGLGGLKETKLFLPHPRVKVSIVGSLRDREVACSASDRQGSNFESCVWRTVSSQSSHHPQEVLLAQFSLYVHKGGLKPDSFHFFTYWESPAV